MINAGRAIAANSSTGMTFEPTGRPSPNAPRRLWLNSDRTRYQRPSRAPS
jgi:hypothetical protein